MLTLLSGTYKNWILVLKSPETYYPHSKPWANPAIAIVMEWYGISAKNLPAKISGLNFSSPRTTKKNRFYLF